MIYGYARVSTKGQDKYGNGLDVQEKQLKEKGTEKIFYEAFTGTKKDRPQLNALMAEIQKGDTLVVTKLDRIARSTADGIAIIDALVEKGVILNVLNMGVFDNSAQGKLMRNIFLAFAEFERDMIVQRTQEGKDICRLNENWREGRKRKEIDGFENFLQKTKSGELSVSECCKELGISRATWYKRASEISA